MRGPSFVVLSMLLLASVGALAPGCAATSAEVKQARDAEYDPQEAAAVFEACKATMIEAGYDIAGEDLQHGLLISTWRWYSPEGMAKRKEAPMVENGSAMFRLGVELAKGPHGGVIVHIDGGAQGYTSGSPVAHAFKHGDPDEPTWVEGKIDSLAVTIHERVAKYELQKGAPAPTAPTASASAAKP